MNIKNIHIIMKVVWNIDECFYRKGVAGKNRAVEINVLNIHIYYQCVTLSTIHNWDYWSWNSLVTPVSKFWTKWNIQQLIEEITLVIITGIYLIFFFQYNSCLLDSNYLRLKLYPKICANDKAMNPNPSDLHPPI